MAVLGATMRDSDAVGQVLEALGPDDFYKPAHRKILESIIALFERNEPVDLVTVAADLERSGSLEACGGRAALIDIADSVFTSANAATHARIVQDKAVLRRLIATAQHITKECQTAPGDVGDLLDEAEARIFAISETRERKDVTKLSDILPQTFDSIEEYHKQGGGITGLATGYDELDSITAGMHKAELLVLAGRPSMGKTALALNKVLASDHKPKIYVYSAHPEGGRGWCFALAESGVVLGKARVATENRGKRHLGATDKQSDRHNVYLEHYPAGYAMEFVPSERIKTHAGLIQARIKNMMLADTNKEKNDEHEGSGH